ncbi:hypothetical protein C0Q70_12142 [Pomacea canaliculata]|uniref:Fibronectin type-III domain-containing protein n=1 Tax=Pomacea canaliculata TaxID=400727 RepID=A0A2T7P0R1_POMCA|nr:hypothetical protein C0Q70_12142 [Pomacea canaliculata]
MKYSFILQTDVPGSETVEKTVSIPPYPAPVNVEVRELRNSSVHITWQPNKDQPSGEDFKGYNLTIQHVDTAVTSVVTSVVIQQSSYMFDAIPGFLYNLTLHVVVKDAPPGETDHHLFSGYQPTASNVVGTITLSKTNFVAILVPIGIVVVGLMVLVMVFVVRHRRLQRSFLAFANSHYNTRSETTRFGNELDDGDEPLIQGFSDDEPLVLA